MIVYFLRHASAGERKKDPVRDDRRGLDANGVKQAGDIGRLLARLEVQVEAVISSPLKRATQTAAVVANEIGHDGRLQLDAALRPQANLADFRDLLGRYAHLQAILVVGHSPNLRQFLGRLIGDAGHPAEVELKKGAIAKVEVLPHRSRLQWCLSPRIVRAMAGLTLTPHPMEKKSARK